MRRNNVANEAASANNVERDAVLRAILHDSQKSISLSTFLARVLDRLLDLPWITLESRGAIFVIEGQPPQLRLKAQRGLPPALLDRCQCLPLGKCLCGRAAATGQLIFAAHVDERHEVRYAGMHEHGHYCVPIMAAGTAIGVLSCYISAGHTWDADEAQFLRAAADILAGTIRFKQAEELLHERETRYTLAVAGLDAGIWDWDLRTNQVIYSARWKQMLGYSDGEISSDWGEWERRLHPDDQHRAVTELQTFVHGESDDYESEHRLRHRDGSYRWVLARGAVARDEHHRVYRMVGSNLDITTTKLALTTLKEHELQFNAAQRIQKFLLPHASPNLHGFDIAGACHPAKFAAGDYFDYLPLPDDGLGLVVADVSGHGFASALLTASVQSSLRALVDVRSDVDGILQHMNRQLLDQEDESQFVTVLFAQIDVVSRRLTYINAGHPAGYVLDSAGEVKHVLSSTSPALGLFPDAEFVWHTDIVLQPGDLLLLLTDGTLETFSPESLPFGIERTLAVVREHRHLPAQEIVQALYREILSYCRCSYPHDDLTSVVAKVLETSAPTDGQNPSAADAYFANYRI